MLIPKMPEPETVNDLVGSSQKRICQLMLDQVENDTLPHTIALFGQTGIGKTTIAKIVANKLSGEFTHHNCKNLKIQDVRDILSNLTWPSVFGKPKVVFLDELGELTKVNQKALLVDLENLPEHAYIFSATTEPEKIIKDIKDRFANHYLRPPSESELKTWLLKVLPAYNLGLTKGDTLLLDGDRVLTAQELNVVIRNAKQSIRGLYRELEALSAGEPVRGFIAESDTYVPQLVLKGDLNGVLSALNSLSDSQIENLAVGLVIHCLKDMSPQAQSCLKVFGGGALQPPIVKADFVSKMLLAIDNYPKSR